ncbi:MAG: protein-S-isoprenylcysteine methyltransferase [Ignavibacteriaceae bacterium]|jgi:methanethiol S-methyltransferase|nr:protein-S-isoprenylcysteine methyltransferase [Ignavibacteriaceae bacterium]
MKYFFICGLWMAYCVLHSFLISTSFTKFISRLLKKYYAFYRLFYVLSALILLILLIDYTSPYDNEIIVSYTFPWSIIRYALMYGSLLLFFWAFFFNYDSLSFFGIRQILNSGKELTIDPAESIKKNGLLGVIRHPMYLALIIFLWSTIFTLMDLLINTLLTIYVIIGTILEEKKLILEFGDAYKKYQQEVPMLVPFIKPKAV